MEQQQLGSFHSGQPPAKESEAPKDGHLTCLPARQRRPKIIVIVAVAENTAAIGRKGKMLFHVPDDLKRFKALTVRHSVIMGRKTFESLPKGALPKRRNIVVTRNPSYEAPGAEIAHSFDEAIEMCRGEKEVYIIGGAQLYAQAVDCADRAEFTIFHAPTPEDADTFFPYDDLSKWRQAETPINGVDAKTGIPYTFVSVVRR